MRFACIPAHFQCSNKCAGTVLYLCFNILLLLYCVGPPLQVDDDDDDDWSMGPKKGKKGKAAGKGGGASKGSSSKGTSSSSTTPGKQKDGGKQGSNGAAGDAGGSVLEVQTLAAKILELHPDMEGVGGHADVACCFDLSSVMMQSWALFVSALWQGDVHTGTVSTSTPLC